MLRSVEIQHHMLQNPVKILETADIFAAVELILSHKVSGLCVVNDDGDLVGVLSELDCLKAILSSMYDDRTNVGMVREYMSTDIETATFNDDIVKVADDMVKNHRRRRPVVKEGKLVGQITCRQLLKAVSEFSRTNSRKK